MRLLNWLASNQSIKEFLNNSDQKSYLSKLIDDIQKQSQENINLPFKITDIKEKGFIVKVGGLYGFISFNHMPWKYHNIVSWEAVFSFIKGKIFFCKIYRYTKEPVSVIIDGKTPQFKKPALEVNCKYKGVIINKTKSYLFIDIGYAFNWKCGSLLGVMHKSDFESPELFKKSETGNTIEIFFLGYNENEQLIFGNKTESKEWLNGSIDQLIGQILPVNISKTERGKTEFFVQNKYRATLSILKSIYQYDRMKIIRAKEKLKNGDVIHCEIIRINKTHRVLQLKWESFAEIESILSRKIIQINKQSLKSYEITDTRNTIKNMVDGELVEKLNLIGRTVTVETIRKEDYFGKPHFSYLVADKYKGKLIISSESYKISNKETKQIEKQLQNGEILDCDVLGIDKKEVIVKWTLTDKELFRLLDR